MNFYVFGIPAVQLRVSAELSDHLPFGTGECLRIGDSLHKPVTADIQGFRGVRLAPLQSPAKLIVTMPLRQHR